MASTLAHNDKRSKFSAQDLLKQVEFIFFCRKNFI
jgi:hypothetical protein